MTEKGAREREISDTRADDLTERERQETRVVNRRVLDEMVSGDLVKEYHRKVDDLWRWLGWIPQVMQNWKALMVAGAIAAMIGGRGFVENVSTWLTGLLP